MSLSLRWTPGTEPRWSMDTGVGHACLATSAATHRLLGMGVRLGREAEPEACRSPCCR